MENQHKKITGYRELTQKEIDLMNEIKAKGNEFNELVRKLEFMLGELACDRGEAKEDLRWVAIGKTHLQQGIMALVRAVAKPESF